MRLTVTALAGCAAIVFAAYAVVRMKDFRELPYQGPNASERITATIQDMKQTSSIKSLAIWGWEPGVYVLSGIPPATRDSIGHFVISLGFSRPYFRERFVADLRREKPDLFIDAVAPGAFMWFWSERNGYESDVELKRFIDDHYILVRELPLKTDARPVRFFQRR